MSAATIILPKSCSLTPLGEGGHLLLQQKACSSPFSSPEAQTMPGNYTSQTGRGLACFWILPQKCHRTSLSRQQTENWPHKKARPRDRAEERPGRGDGKPRSKFGLERKRSPIRGGSAPRQNWSGRVETGGQITALPARQFSCRMTACTASLSSAVTVPTPRRSEPHRPAEPAKAPHTSWRFPMT